MITREFKVVSVMGLTDKQVVTILQKNPSATWSRAEGTVTCKSVEQATEVRKLVHADRAANIAKTSGE